MKLAGWSITTLFAIIGGVYGAVTLFATKTDVQEVHGEVVVVQNDLQIHKLEDQAFYLHKRVWYIQQQEGVRRCEDIQDPTPRYECQELEQKARNLEDRKKALCR